MIRKHILVSQQLDEQIKLRAKMTKKPEAQIMREALAEGIQTIKPRHKGGEALLDLAKLGIRGPADLSRNLDKYLYEHDK